MCQINVAGYELLFWHNLCKLRYGGSE